MRYLSYTASKPGLLENTVLEFDDNPVIVYGRNGSGKTLIAKSLVDILYRKLSGCSTVSEDAWDSLYLDVHVSLGDDDRFRLTSNGNRQYTICASLNGEESVIISRGDADEHVDRREMPHYARVMDFYELIDASAFKTASFLPSPADLNPGETISYASLRGMMINDRSVCCRSSAANGKAAEPSPWSKLENLVAVLETGQRSTLKRIQLIDVSRNRMEKLLREKKNINREIREINETQTSLGSQKKILQGIANDLKEIEELNGELDGLRGTILQEEVKSRQAAELKNEIDTHFPHLQKIGLNEIPSLEVLQEIFNGIKNLNEQMDSRLFSRKLKKRRLMTTGAGIIIASLISAGALFAGKGISDPVNVNMIIGILSAAVTILASLALYFAFTSRKKELDKLNQDKIDLENSIKEKIKGNRIDYDGEKVHELYDFLLQYFEDYLEFSEKTREYHRLTNSLEAKEYFDEVTGRLDTLKTDVDQVKKRIENGVAALEIVKNFEINENEIQSLTGNIDREIENAEQRLHEKERILHQINKEIVEQPDSREELKTLTRHKTSEDIKVKILNSRMNAMNFVRASLAEAELRRESRQLKKLVKNTLEKFNYLTGNQYITKIDERTIQEILSTGTVPADMNPAVAHGIILSAKLSMTDIITNSGMSLPLIIDDPFYNMDEARMTRFRSLVGEASKSRQVILFTHQKDASDWGKFIEL